MVVPKEEQLSKPEVKILVVDSQENSLLAIERILKQEDYVICKADSGRAALNTLSQEKDFSLILMAIQMPELNGFETAALIYEKEELKNIPILFMVANSQHEELKVAGFKLGMVDFIYKPINPEVIRYKVGVFINFYQKTQQLMQKEESLHMASQSLAREVEERRVLEEKMRSLSRQLVKNTDELKSTNKERDRFEFVTSHDLQEPLRKIMVFSDLIALKLKENQDPDVQASLDKIVRSSGRMRRLLNDLIQFSRLSSGEEGFRQADLNKIVAEVLAELDSEIQFKEAQIVVDKLPVIQAIPSQLKQLFQNLIGNALKFSKAGKAPLIQISCERIQEEEEMPEESEGERATYYRISVKDNGIGFDPKYAEAIFLVFMRLHGYLNFEGSGIGLAICKKIAERHRGVITAHGQPGEGAVFTVTLPEGQIEMPLEKAIIMAAKGSS